MANKPYLTAVSAPNLPIYRVRVCAVSAQYSEVISALLKLGIECLAIDSNSNFPKPVDSHADLQLLHIGGKDIVCVPNLCEKLSKYGFRTVVHDMTGRVDYPHHVDLCNLIVGEYCICLKENPLTRTVLERFNTVNVKQGYVRCSVAVVTKNAFMTSDVPIAKELCKLGFDVLLLPSGDILLPPYEYGFIGGTCGKISRHELAFTGSLDRYMYGDMVKKFLKEHDVKPLYLTNGKLMDIGGIIPLAE